MSNNPVKEMLSRATETNKRHMSRIEAQRMTIDRLLDARNSQASDGKLIAELAAEQSAILDKLIQYRKSLEELLSLARINEGGALASSDVQALIERALADDA